MTQEPPRTKRQDLFIVFNPEGTTAPVKTHGTHQEACAAAWIMANRFPGQRFYIMRRNGRAAFVPPPEPASESDGSPTGEDPKGLSAQHDSAVSEGNWPGDNP